MMYLLAPFAFYVQFWKVYMLGRGSGNPSSRWECTSALISSVMTRNTARSRHWWLPLTNTAVVLESADTGTARDQEEVKSGLIAEDNCNSLTDSRHIPVDRRRRHGRRSFQYGVSSGGQIEDPHESLQCNLPCSKGLP
jgi:hypothetical protein